LREIVNDQPHDRQQSATLAISRTMVNSLTLAIRRTMVNSVTLRG
jgi:hypothetical protein